MARIIIADDDEPVTEIACDELTSAGHDTGALSNRSDALYAITTNSPIS